MTFRFQAKYGLVTYAQCGALDPWRVLDHFTKMGAECIIGRESHHDGGTHLHVFFQFEEKRRLSGVHIFDVDGYHPNVVPGYSNPRKGWEYATKDGDIVCGGLGCPSDGSDNEGKTDSKWAVIVASPDADTFWENVKSLDPRALCLSFTSLQAYASHRYRPDRNPYVHPGELLVDSREYPQLQEWVDNELRVSSKDRYVVVTPIKGVPLGHILC